MTTTRIQEQVQGLVLEVLPDVTLEELQDDVDIFNLGLDSINTMTLISNLQETFEIELDVSEISFENFQNISTIVEMIEEKKSC
ncbi:MAG: acyl carrier protein [Okeania sp. SIO1H6]|uniref:Acyl carrier protein n=1 Tax=Okeania hirsuta TaxID=1458930 RepID=A0A3N6NFS6_9CYAN|nr:acyl carrier protein [Okeania sp. SIO4D6]NEP44841.1 acyl carrier protein [Okeania sp. SIO2H7]NEP73955.1 acyl carrier protein [Okeania sp. SIO2G5]NEP94770.1 acyl carrier protein [Okeania sp. SIO2F5]NEQ92466.1 acyl carrier protein [Okeania sp. SIO2G4]NES76377.1 acyl carrier protein [Okeania sp. SIO1H4]NES88839.1 acyl carrier protein [Okeania sp. SIO2B9]NET13363.1 acyl carrier protein [Okeania sp. SIO1H6]NET19824.1 acyl carrier protein [Okeania sp. SIO1H5]NET77710.1 acyl carrier protein [O